MTATTARLGDPHLHFFMTRSVARVLGLNLSEALLDGTLPTRTYEQMITRCRTCQHVETCQEWLSDCRNCTDAPPDCRNGHILQALQDVQTATP